MKRGRLCRICHLWRIARVRDGEGPLLRTQVRLEPAPQDPGGTEVAVPSYRVIQSGQSLFRVAVCDQLVDHRERLGSVVGGAFIVDSLLRHLRLDQETLDSFIVRIESLGLIEKAEGLVEWAIVLEGFFNEMIDFLPAKLATLGVDLRIQFLEFFTRAVQPPGDGEFALGFVDRALFGLAIDAGDHLVDGDPSPVGIDPALYFGLGFGNKLNGVRYVSGQFSG